MCAFSSILPLALTVTTLILGLSVAALANKNDTAIPHVARSVKGVGNAPNSTIIKGSYIVLLVGKTSAAKVKSTATGTAATMQNLKQQLIANVTLQATTNDLVNVPTNRIFTKSVKAFLINGVSDAMVSSLRQTKGVISVEPDTVTNTTNLITKGSAKQKSGMRSLQTPDIWGVKKIGGPIPLSAVPNPNRKIFVLGTGISPNTKDLIIDPNLSVNLIDQDNPDQWGDKNGWGTAMAGIIASKVVGVVPGATWLQLKCVTLPLIVVTVMYLLALIMCT
jgi:phenylpyruvate tautomerase PptA (4-oxalocrotonate tautomerase family)